MWCTGSKAGILPKILEAAGVLAKAAAMPPVRAQITTLALVRLWAKELGTVSERVSGALLS